RGTVREKFTGGECSIMLDRHFPLTRRDHACQPSPGIKGGEMKIARLMTAIGVCAMVAVTAEAAFAASKCSGDKIKAAGKKAGSKLTCLSKGLAKGQVTDST